MDAKFLFCLGLGLVLSACGAADAPYLPDGDVDSGKQVFTNLKCFGCHEVIGEGYPQPTAVPPTYVALGKTGKKLDRRYIAESIIAPSHQFAAPSPPGEAEASAEWIMAGPESSRMGDYSKTLTVRELLDLVAYLERVQGGSTEQQGT